MVKFSERILIVSHNASACEHLIRLFERENGGKSVPDLLSLMPLEERALNKRYGLDAIAKTKELLFQQAIKRDPELMRKISELRNEVISKRGKVVVAPLMSLLVSGTGKNILDKYFLSKHHK